MVRLRVEWAALLDIGGIVFNKPQYLFVETLFACFTEIDMDVISWPSDLFWKGVFGGGAVFIFALHRHRPFCFRMIAIKNRLCLAEHKRLDIRDFGLIACDLGECICSESIVFSKESFFYCFTFRTLFIFSAFVIFLLRTACHTLLVGSAVSLTPFKGFFIFSLFFGCEFLLINMSLSQYNTCRQFIFFILLYGEMFRVFCCQPIE